MHACNIKSSCFTELGSLWCQFEEEKSVSCEEVLVFGSNDP